ncbi:hypothetical protein JCM8547_003457 [Rhodosporidiobolus lusitaniae]
MPGLKAHSTPPKSPKSKGKQRASAPSPSSSAFAPSTDSPPPAKRTRSAAMQSSPVLEQDEDQEDENNMLSLAERIADAAHLLVKGRGSDTLAKQARDVVKRSFDSALASESLSFPHLSTLLASLSPSSGPTTRSSASRTAAPEPSASSFTLEETPISELTVEDMDPEMIWEQMELRGRTVDGLMEEMFGQTEEGEEEGEEGEGGEFEFDGEEEEGEEGSSEGEEEEGSEDDGEEPPTPEEEEYFRRLASGEAEEDEDEEESEEDEQEQQELEDPEADATRGLTLDNFDGEGRGKKSRASGGARRSTGPPSAVDDAFFSLHDFHVDADEGEFEMAKMLKGELPSDDDEDDGNDGGEGGIDLFAPVGGLGEDEEQEEEEEGDLDAGGVMYRDFFDPPRRTAPRPDKDKKKGSLAGKDKGKKPAPAAEEEEDAPPAAAEGAKKRGVRFSENVKVKEIPHRLAGRGKRGLSAEEEEDEDEKEEGDEEEGEEDEDEFEAALARLEGGDDGFGEDEDEDEEMRDGEEEADEDEDEEDDIEEGQETIERFKDSLFDDEEDEEKDPKKNLSRHERRLLQLSSQIEALEQENVGKKNWATTGEAQARDRPMDSLLEEDLEFERMGKVAPQVTEETTKGIEELIKKRILDNQFDDVERRRPVDPNALLPSRFMELQDSQSKKSLAEVYEDEFRDARDREQGKEVVNELDKDLQEKHDEIEALFEELAGRLDALSNARFTPKAPKATITTVSNLPSISLESALPTTNSTSTLLAPEEVYSAHARHSALAIDAADLTPAQKKAARQKGREARKSQHEKKERVLEREMKRRGVRGEKEKAEKTLVGLRGVTVLGKGGEVKKGGGVKRKRGEEGGRGEPSGVGLKL